MEIYFGIFNLIALIPWLLMICFPDHKITGICTDRQIPVVMLCSIYFVLFSIQILGPNNTFVDFMDFNSVKQAFSNDLVMLLGWVHYLAFDLFIGIYIFENMKQQLKMRLSLRMILVITLFLGPIGYLIFALSGRSRDKKSQVE